MRTGGPFQNAMTSCWWSRLWCDVERHVAAAAAARKQRQGGGRVRRRLHQQGIAHRLYKSCDAFVSAHRGEGYGMKILDAMACGLPVVAPLFGGPTDFLTTTNSFPIDFSLVPVGDCLDTRSLKITNSPMWAEPDVESMASQLRRVADGPGRCPPDRPAGPPRCHRTIDLGECREGVRRISRLRSSGNTTEPRRRRLRSSHGSNVRPTGWAPASA